jgi:hypothetical protein
MKPKSPRNLSYAERLAASTKVTAARNAVIVKEILAGTRTAGELAGFYKVQVGTIRGRVGSAPELKVKGELST